MQSGRGDTEQDYIVFWNDGQQKHATPVHVIYPPHEQPRGGVLEELIVSALREDTKQAVINLHGAVSFYGDCRELVVGDGRVGQASLEQGGWRVHL